jgi:CHAT domain-containing protein
MPEAPGPRATASRTAIRSWVKRLLFIAIVCAAISCGRPKTAYEHARAAYQEGDIARALAEANSGEVRWKDPQSPWHWEFRLLSVEALITLARYPEAETKLAQEPPAQLREQRARLLIDRAAYAAVRQKDGEAFLRQARELAPGGELAIRIELVDGTLALNRRQHERARQLYQTALDLAVQQESILNQANALTNLSISAKRLNHYEESIDYALRAIDAAQKAGARRVEAAAHGNAGPSYAYLGQFESAFAHEQQAVQIHEATGARYSMMTAVGELGLIYDRADRVPEAIPHYRRAYDLACELGLKRDASRFAENLALALIKNKQWDEAAVWNDRAAELAKETDAKATLPYLVRNRASIAWGRGHADEATSLCRELLRTNAEQPSIAWEAYELLGEIDTAAGRYADANRNFENALRIIDATRSEVLDSRNRVTLLSRLITFYRDYVDALIVQGDDARALRVAESSRARVLGERLGRDLKPEQMPDAAGLRAFAKSSKTALLSFWIAPKRSFAWLVTPKRVRRFDLPPAAEIESLVTDYRQVVEHSIADPLAESSARVLWQKVMAEIAADVPQGSRVIVIPDGPLHRLNLETLVAPAPQPHYWIEDAEIATSPSMTIAMSKAGAARGDGSVLVIGAPEYAGTGYDALPGAAAEVQQLRTRFSNVEPAVFTGKQASPACYRAARPEKYSVIHFAAHAEANLEKPLESAVVLSRAGDSYKLFARDVIDIPIHADLVTLSACRSAGSRTYAGEGLMGFAWAFLQAGAHAVVAGLWDVSDTSTGPLMAKFYEGVAQKTDTATALRAAKLSLLREGRYRKAFYWGAFQVYEGGIRAPDGH